MANKKAASTAKKSTAKSSGAKKQTKVTTVKATETGQSAKTAPAKRRSFVGGFKRMPLVAAAIAEFVGTFLLTSVIVTQQNSPIAVMFALVAIVLIIGGLSGAHVNPAITVGAWITRKMKAARALAYIVAQVLGAVLALVVLDAFLTDEAPQQLNQLSLMQQGAAATAPALYALPEVAKGTEWALFFAEFLGLTVLGLAYASALQKGREKIASAFAVGTGIFLAVTLAGTAAFYAIDGIQQLLPQYVALNPAAAIAFGGFNDFTSWTFAIFAVAPIFGSVLGFFLYDMLKSAEDNVA